MEEKEMPKFYVKRKQDENNFTNVGYDEMNEIIGLIYNSDEMGEFDYGNQTVYLNIAKKEMFSIDKGEKGEAIVAGKFPSDLENRLKDCDLKLIRKKD